MFQNLLREAGCLPGLRRIIRGHNMATKIGTRVAYPGVVSGTANCINNLAMNTENQAELQVKPFVT